MIAQCIHNVHYCVVSAEFLALAFKQYLQIINNPTNKNGHDMVVGLGELSFVLAFIKSHGHQQVDEVHLHAVPTVYVNAVFYEHTYDLLRKICDE